MAESTRSFKIPRVIGGFRIIEKIGQGAMGAVYKARQPSLDRDVALKIVPPRIAKDEKFIGRFQREARASAKLNHPHIVQGIDVGKDEKSGLWYFAMEYVDGPTALQLMKKEGKVSERRALEIARDMARALECAEKARIVHRDIKPDNILLCKSGEAKLADLGLAKRTGDDSETAHLTQSGKALGTPYYMAPEQVRGENDDLDVRTDFYALGATLFHLLTGETPFHGPTNASIMAKHITDEPPALRKLNPAVGEPAAKIVRRLMEKKREKRYQKAAELIAALDALLEPERKPQQRGGPKAGTSAVRSAVGPRSGATGPRIAISARARSSSSALPIVLGLAAAGILLAVVLGGGLGSRTPPRANRATYEEEPASTAQQAPRPTTTSPWKEKPKPKKPGPQPEAKPEAQPEPPTHENMRPIVETTPPAEWRPAHEPDQPPPISADAAARYEQFQEEFLAALLQRDLKNAEKKLKFAESDTALKALAEKLALDRKALGWPARGDAGIEDGARQLIGIERFELKQASGPPMAVGKKGKFLVYEVKDGELNLGSSGMGFKIRLDKLHAETRGLLAEMALGGTGEGEIVLAFSALLDGGDAEKIKAHLARARETGAAEAEIEYVQRLLGRHETAAAGDAAVRAWGKIQLEARPAEWDDARRKRIAAALDAFETSFGASEFGMSKADEIASLRARLTTRGAEVPNKGLLVWLRPDRGVVSDNGRVVQWTNQAGRSGDAVQRETGKRPTIVENALQGLPALKFDGQDDHLEMPGVRGPMRRFTLMWTLKPYSVGNNTQTLGAKGAWGEFTFHTTRDGSVFAGTSMQSRITPADGAGPNTLVPNEWQQFCFTHDENESRLYRNGRLVAAKKLDWSEWSGFRIGGDHSASAIDGEMTELILWDRVLTGDERQTVEAHLMPSQPVR